jgi:predicted dinucleotide-binding enzyme
MRVVKSLNTMNCSVMVDPKRVPGRHDVFVAGNDAIARQTVAGHLVDWFGWTAPIDLGDITAARGLEMWLPLWVRLYGSLRTGDFNLSIVRA